MNLSTWLTENSTHSYIFDLAHMCGNCWEQIKDSSREGKFFPILSSYTSHGPRRSSVTRFHESDRRTPLLVVVVSGNEK